MRHFVCNIILCIIFISCCGCSNQTLPIQEYPLDKTFIETELESVDLSWKVTNESRPRSNQIVYELFTEEGMWIAIISSVESNDERFMQMSFFTSTAIASPVPSEDWEKAITLATILYGGFSEEKQVYQSFENTYEEISLVEKGQDARQQEKEIIKWRNEVNGVDCFIVFNRLEPNSEFPTTEIVSIVFTNMDD